MSLKKSATRRLSLLTGSSLVVASLTALGGLALAPAAATAQATCTSPAAPAGNGTAAVTIAVGTYNPGITCSYVGPGSTVATAGAITVSSTAGGDGINLSATGASAINWNSAAGAVTGGANTNGPLIEATSVSGAISITTAGVTANAAGTTYGIQATSSGGGAITITRAAGGVNNGVAGGLAAIEAVTNGGAISITTASGFTTGRERGIRAQTSGTGTVTLTLNGQVSADASSGVAAADITAGTGAVNLTLTNGALTGGAGKALIVNSAGAVTVNNTGGSIGAVSNNMPNGGGAVDFSGVSGAVTVTHTGSTDTRGRWLASGDSVFGAGNDTVNLQGIGHNYLGGRNALADASIDFGAGNDTLNVSAFLAMGGFTQDAGSIDFGSGSDTFNLSGVFSSNGGALTNLETFNNSGVIYMGVGATTVATPAADFTKTDGAADDRLSLPGTAFTGSGDGRIVMDVLLGGASQEGCATMAGVADCLYLPGGSTAGTTILTLNNLGATSSQGGYDPVGITIIDVEGGTSAQGHFVLDPDTPNLIDDPLYGDAISRPGLFVYALQYDPGTQRHRIVGLPRGEALGYAVLGGAAQSVWHMSTAAITDRQGDLRAGAEGALWLRVSGEYSKRDIATEFDTGGGALAVDNGYKLYAGQVMGGVDLIVGEREDYDYVLGAQIGYVTSSFDLTASPSSGRFTGAGGGVYGSFWSDNFFLDGAINANVLTLDYEAPGLASRTNTYVNSVGAQVEGGARAMLTERTFVEPLMTLAFVRTSFEEISLSGGEVTPADTESRRGALGLRVGTDLRGGPVNISYFLTGRAWNEFEGTSGGVVNNPGLDLPYADDFSGSFGEAQAGINLYSDDNTFSGFLATGVKFKKGYDAVDLSLGVRLRW